MLTVLVIAFCILATVQLVAIIQTERFERYKMDNAEDLETDLEIAQADQRAYQDLIRSIVQNRRLAWEIVSAWLEANGYLLIPKNYTGQVNQGNNEKARE